MLPTPQALSSFDVFRDGGSLSASFVDDAGTLHELFFPIHLVARSQTEFECLGYHLPKLSTYHPATHTLPGSGETYASWDRTEVIISWQDARTLLEALSPQVPGFVTNYPQVFSSMVEIAATDGRLANDA